MIRVTQLGKFNCEIKIGSISVITTTVVVSLCVSVFR